MSFATARHQWEDGARHVARARRPGRDVMERVVEQIVQELRRRLGGTFSVDELALLYRGGVDWALALAHEHAPEMPAAWDGRVIDAAFERYARQAEDFAGGRRHG